MIRFLGVCSSPFTTRYTLWTVLFGGVFVAVLHAQSPESKAPVVAVVETTLETEKGQIRQFAFDGDANTSFVSARAPKADDHFTLIFDEPVTLQSITLITGWPEGEDGLDRSSLDAAGPDLTYKEMVKFTGGKTRVEYSALQQSAQRFDDLLPKIKAVRIRPGKLKGPFVIREIEIVSKPAVAVFKYPVEITIEVSDAPEMKEWAEKAARACERSYTLINDELASPGHKPRKTIEMKLTKKYGGVAFASRGNIVGSARYFKANPEDVGAMVHETVHCVQDYRTWKPSWLVEGIADYVRFIKYEPDKIGPLRDNPHYNNSYRTTAAFLGFVVKKYDPDLVRKLNRMLREGEYKEEIWRTLTKKTIQELDEEWRASVKPKR